MMKSYFAKTEMSALWGRLKGMRKRAPGAAGKKAREDWEKLEKGEVGSSKYGKNAMLSTALVSPEDWAEIWAKERHIISEEFEQKEKGLWKTQGELVALKGFAETESDIKKGKYETTEDEWGDTWYRKVE